MRSLLAAGIAVALRGCMLARFDPEDPRHGPSLADSARALDAEVRRQVRLHGTARRDGFTYALDLAPLMLHAARRGDRAFYERLHDDARKLVWRRADDAETRGFVL